MNIKSGLGILLLLSVTLLACGVQESDTEQASEAPAESEVSRLTAAITDNPDNAGALYDRAKYHYAAQNYADAVYDLAAAMQIDSINEDYHLLLADVYLEGYESELALRTIERSVRLFPESIRSRLKAAEMQIILRRYQDASTSLQRIFEIEPQNIEALQLLGILFKEQGQMDRAIQSFQTVVELDGDNYEAWTMLGNLLDIKGDPLALQCFENAIAIDSTYPQGWHSKAFYLQNQGDIDQALEIYETIHRIAPNYTDAYLNAGILYLEKKDYANAEQEFVRYSEITPRDPMAPFYLGLLFEEQQDYPTALRYFNQASSLSPRNARFSEAVERMKIELGQ